MWFRYISIASWFLLVCYGVSQFYKVFIRRYVDLFDILQCSINVSEDHLQHCIEVYIQQNKTQKDVQTIQLLATLLIPLRNRQVFSRFTLQALQCPYCIDWLDYFLFILPTHLLVPYLKAMAVFGWISYVLFDYKSGITIRHYLLITLTMAIIIESLIIMSPTDHMSWMTTWPSTWLAPYISYLRWNNWLTRPLVVQLMMLRYLFFGIIAILQGYSAWKMRYQTTSIQDLSECVTQQEDLKDVIRAIYLQHSVLTKNETVRNKWISACCESEKDWELWLMKQPDLSNLVEKLRESHSISTEDEKAHPDLKFVKSSIDTNVKQETDRILGLIFE
jgi:hypothetical protein